MGQRDEQVNRTRPLRSFIPPALTIGIAIQPEVLESLAEKGGFRGQGLLARFLYALPRSLIGKRKVEPAPVAREAREEYQRIVKAIMDCATRQADTPAIVALDADALMLVREHQADIEKLLVEGGQLEPIQDWANKLTGALVRIAVGFHCVAYSSEADTHRISSESMGRALALSPYLRSHALKAFNAMGVDPVIEDAKRILDWLRKRKIRCISARSIFQENCSRFERMAAVQASLHILEERGYVRQVLNANVHHAPGRPRSPNYEINPVLYPPSTQNSQNARRASAGGVLRVLGDVFTRR